MDNQGYNALHLAIHGNQSLMVLLLMGLGMDVNTLDSAKRTPLMWASYLSASAHMIPLLVEWGADLNLSDSTGFTSLHWAVCSSNYESAAILIKKGADIQKQDSNGKTPGDWASERQQASTYLQALAYAPSIVSSQWLTKDHANNILYSLVFIFMPICFWFASQFMWYWTFLFFIFLNVTGLKLVNYFLLKPTHLVLSESALITAIPQASLFYCFLTWIHLFYSSFYLANFIFRCPIFCLLPFSLL
jgi:palmitoyltransferase